MTYIIHSQWRQIMPNNSLSLPPPPVLRREPNTVNIRTQQRHYYTRILETAVLQNLIKYNTAHDAITQLRLSWNFQRTINEILLQDHQSNFHDIDLLIDEIDGPTPFTLSF